jgi:hypothetical protein
MALLVQLDVRFPDDLGVGVEVDTDIYVEVWEDGGSSPNATRTLGTDHYANVVKATDSGGVYYYTFVDVVNYVHGTITARWFAKSGGITITPYPTVLTAEYPQSNELSGASLKEYVLNMLGYPSVTVELTSSNFTTAINETLSVYNRWCARELPGAVSLVSGQYAYPLPGVSSRGVTDVTFVRKDQLALTAFPFFGREFPIWPQIQFDEFVLAQSHWETVRRMASVDPDWEWQVQNSTLYITLGGPSGSQDPSLYDVHYRYRQDVSLTQVPLSHHSWFRRYCLAVCKEILGRARGKWSGTVPSPGGNLTLDAASLLEEARAERASLDEEIRRFAPVVPMVWG